MLLQMKVVDKYHYSDTHVHSFLLEMVVANHSAFPLFARVAPHLTSLWLVAAY